MKKAGSWAWLPGTLEQKGAGGGGAQKSSLLIESPGNSAGGFRTTLWGSVLKSLVGLKKDCRKH